VPLERESEGFKLLLALRDVRKAFLGSWGDVLSEEMDWDELNNAIARVEEELDIGHEED
jgi:hypothetical protein